MRKRHLSLEETNKLLPFVRRKMAMLAKLDRAVELLDNVSIMFDDDFLMMKQDVSENLKFHKMNADFYKIMSELLAVGCIVKDLRTGLVDFYSMHEGKEIFLCYKMGEEDIQFWHEAECGFDERKPISLLIAKKISQR